MLETTKSLGKFQRVYGTSPVYLQRAAIIAVVSFVFFLAMLIAFSIRQNIGYFLLATAFLLVQLLTLFGWITQRKNELKLYENGFEYRKNVYLWNEIKTTKMKTESRMLSGRKINFEITKINGEKIVLTEAIHQIAEILARIDREVSADKKNV
ncbi:MAG TPA: DUF6585 family protein [Pyrinomonadaceae bacterium]|jgi:hypothetical protein